LQPAKKEANKFAKEAEFESAADMSWYKATQSL